MDIRTQVQSTATKSIVDNKFNGIIEVAPRVGKTKIVIDALNTVSADITVLVLAPRKEIFESWKVEIKKWKLADNISVDFLWSNSLKKNTKTYNLIICDEVHSYNLNVLSLLAKEKVKNTRILSITGTLDGNTEYLLETMLKQTVLYTYSISQAIEDNIVADYKIYCIECSLNASDADVIITRGEISTMTTESGAYYTWHNAYEKAKSQQKWSSLRFLMSKRLDIIYNSPTKLEATKQLLALHKRAIVFSGRQEIANQLGDKSFHSKSDKNSLEEFKNKKINKLSVISMVSMGITIPKLKVAIFNQLKSEENLAIQQAMRVMNMEKGGTTAEIFIIYLKNTQDQVWMESALKGFDPLKIIYCTLEDLINGNSTKSRQTKKRKSIA